MKLSPSTKFAIATAAISAAALLETYLARWPGRDRLEHPIFDRLFAFTDNWGAILQIVIVLLVWWIPALRTAGERLARAMGERPGITAAVTFFVLALGARFAYHAHPFSMDEYAPVAQAYAFAQGHLSWFYPPDLLDRMIPWGFRNYFLAVDPVTGEVASMYWPGFAALLTPFVWLGVPWLLNPVITACSVLLIHELAVRVIGTREAGGWAVLFALASPAFTVNGISFYSMPAHLAANLAFALLLLDGRPSRAFFAGLVGGLALILHNPVPHAMFALPWLLWLAWKRDRWPSLLALVAGYLPIGVVVGIGWPMFLSGIRPTHVAAPVHAQTDGLWDLAMSKANRAFRMPDYLSIVARLAGTWKLWIWSMPGLLILAATGLIRARGPLLLLAVSAAATYGIYWFVPFDQGHGWGYRYMHSAWSAIALLAAAAVSGRDSAIAQNQEWRAWSAGLGLASLVLATSLRFWQVDAVISEHLTQVTPAPREGRWLVLIQQRDGLYGWDMTQNFPGKDRVVVLMATTEAEDAAFVASHFPGATISGSDARGSIWRRLP